MKRLNTLLAHHLKLSNTSSSTISKIDKLAHFSFASLYVSCSRSISHSLLNAIACNTSKTIDEEQTEQKIKQT